MKAAPGNNATNQISSRNPGASGIKNRLIATTAVKKYQLATHDHEFMKYRLSEALSNFISRISTHFLPQ